MEWAMCPWCSTPVSTEPRAPQVTVWIRQFQTHDRRLRAPTDNLWEFCPGSNRTVLGGEFGTIDPHTGDWIAFPVGTEVAP